MRANSPIPERTEDAAADTEDEDVEKEKAEPRIPPHPGSKRARDKAARDAGGETGRRGPGRPPGATNKLPKEMAKGKGGKNDSKGTKGGGKGGGDSDDRGGGAGGDSDSVVQLLRAENARLLSENQKLLERAITAETTLRLAGDNTTLTTRVAVQQAKMEAAPLVFAASMGAAGSSASHAAGTPNVSTPGASAGPTPATLGLAQCLAAYFSS